MAEHGRMNRGLTEAQESYVEFIADAEQDHGHAHVSLLSEALGVKKPSVVQMTARLERKGIVKRRDKEVTLTTMGRRIAGDLQGRHTLLQRFMVERLGMMAKEANQEACRLEHVVSSGFINGVRKLTEAER